MGQVLHQIRESFNSSQGSDLLCLGLQEREFFTYSLDLFCPYRFALAVSKKKKKKTEKTKGSRQA